MTLPSVPRRWVKGEGGTAALLDAHVRDAINRLHWLGAYQTADITKNTNTTLANLTGLVIPVLSGEIWKVKAHSFYVSNASADAKWLITAPGGSTGRWGIIGPGAGLGDLSGTDFTTALARSSPGVNEDNEMLFAYVTAGADGNLQVQAAQNTSTAVDTIFRQYSTIIAKRVSGGNVPIADFATNQVLDAGDFQALADALNALRYRHGSLLEEMEATNSAALADLLGMSFPVRAGETWAWFAHLYFKSTAAGDIAMGASAPHGSLGRYGIVGTGSPISPGSASTFNTAVKMDVGNTDEQTASFNGLVIANRDGTVQMKAAQGTATPGETLRMRQDCWFEAYRLEEAA